MTKKAKGISRIDEMLLEAVQDGLVSKPTGDKITMRILGKDKLPELEELSAKEIRALRDRVGMSQAVFARHLNLTAGYVAQLERGAKRPSGAALALLHAIKRKGIEIVQ